MLTLDMTIPNYDNHSHDRGEPWANGDNTAEVYTLRSQLHRTDGPALTTRYPSGKIESQEWYLFGRRHCVDGPAYISYFESGKRALEEYWANGEQHREDGPAVIEYATSNERYYFHGNYICNGRAIRPYLKTIDYAVDKEQAAINIINSLGNKDKIMLNFLIVTKLKNHVSPQVLENLRATYELV